MIFVSSLVMVKISHIYKLMIRNITFINSSILPIFFKLSSLKRILDSAELFSVMQNILIGENFCYPQGKENNP